MHVPDLAPLRLSPFESATNVIAVGWLEPGAEYQHGEVGADFVRKLTDLLVNPWQPVAAAGRHSCGFCRMTGGPSVFRLHGLPMSPDVPMGVSNLWLPGDGVCYVAPSLILHYMDSHDYSPPTEFKLAVMACPPMRSIAYLKALLKNGPPGIASI